MVEPGRVARGQTAQTLTSVADLRERKRDCWVFVCVVESVKGWWCGGEKVRRENDGATIVVKQRKKEEKILHILGHFF